MITDINQLDLNKKYSYADYLSWLFQEKLELFRGTISKMSPAPSRYHQQVSVQLTLLLGNSFKNSNRNLYVAPFDVRLLDKKKSTLDSEIFTVVQPDLCIICDENKLDDKGCIGSPDLIIEILSPGNSKKEMKYKFDLYQEAGVLEYWIVNPENKSVFVYILKDEKYIGMHPLIEEDPIESPLFPNLNFKLEEVFT